MSAPSNRRSFLGRIMAAAAIPAVAAAPAAAAVAPAPKVDEVPELLALDDQLAEAVKLYGYIRERKAMAAMDFALIRAPEVPDELWAVPSPRWPTHHLASVTRVNVDRLTEEVIDDRRIYDAKALKIHILAQDVPTTTREGKRLRRLARLATTYERKVEAAVKASRYPDLAEEHQARLYDVQKILRAILHAPPPLTSIGFKVVARALLAVAAINEAEGRDHLTVGLGNALGVHLARAMLAGEVAR
jgi:hypothetical protein